MTQLPKTSATELDLDQGWLTIWFNQPAKRNALTDELMADVKNAFAAVHDDRSVRGITLRGRGGVFCAGGDLKSFQSDLQGAGDLEPVRELSRVAAELYTIVYNAPQVTVALVEGAAMAGGFGMMCCADVAIAEASAKFALTEVMIGLSPAQISPFVVQRAGIAKARRLMVTAERFTGVEAEQLGLVDFLANEPDELDALEQAVRKRVLRSAPGAIADTKDFLRWLGKYDRAEEVERLADVFAHEMIGEEGREGIASFFEKRPASWTPEAQQ